jgi:hypothetical protein
MILMLLPSPIDQLGILPGRIFLLRTKEESMKEALELRSITENGGHNDLLGAMGQ